MVGYFPATYVQNVSPGNQVFLSQFDFAAEGPGELPLLEGQVRGREGGRKREGERERGEREKREGSDRTGVTLSH